MANRKGRGEESRGLGIRKGAWRPIILRMFLSFSVIS